MYPEHAYLRMKLALHYQRIGPELDFKREFRKFNELSAAMTQRQRAAESSDASHPAGAP